MEYQSLKSNVTCIIPFYNEELKNIKNAIKIARIVSQISNVIVVDDGSDSRENYELLHKSFYSKPDVKIVRLSRNYGKAFAIKFGLSLSFSENILLLDADLKNVKVREISKAIRSFKLFDLDMVILRRINSLPLLKFIRADTLLSGERIIKKEHLRKVLKSNVEGYQLEVAINRYFLKDNSQYKCFWSPSSAVNDYKHRKNKFLKGIIKDLLMYRGLIKYVGFRNFVKQILHFCKQEV
jgi:glycosyltransferase involved in cell wall biosynthesis